MGLILSTFIADMMQLNKVEGSTEAEEVKKFVEKIHWLLLHKEKAETKEGGSKSAGHNSAVSARIHFILQTIR